MNKRGEHDVELLETGEDPTVALQAPEEPFDFVSTLVNLLAVFPGIYPGGQRRHYRREAQVKCQLAGLVALIGAIHDQVHRAIGSAQRGQQLAAFGAVASLSGRERESYCRSSIRGNHMNFGGPSSSGFADGLRAVFFSAPVPSGCTLTMVLSSETDSIRIRRT